MRYNIKALAFDIDGTLLKGDGKTLQTGVPILFKEIYNYTRHNNMPILFISGKNYNEICSFMNILCKEAGIPQDGSFDYKVASNSGGYAEYGDYIALNSQKVKQIVDVVKTVDDSAFIVYKTLRENYIERVRDARPLPVMIKKAGMKVIKDAFKKSHKFCLPAKPLNQTKIEQIVNSEEVLSLNILSFKSKEIANNLKQILPELKFSPSGVYIDVSSKDKLDVVRDFAKFNAFEDGLESVAYFGDSENDEKSLTNCGVGFLCNVKPKKYDLVKKIVCQNNKFLTDDLSNPEIIKCITGQDFNENILYDETSSIVQNKIIHPQQKLIEEDITI